MTRLYMIILIAVFSVFIFAKNAMTEMPVVPPFEQATGWYPLPDRTLLVEFDGIAFRYQILDNKPAPHCQAVVQLPRSQNHELRWITQGFINHQYLTTGTPSFYKELGNEEWLWGSIRTYQEDCLDDICLMR